MGQSCVTAPSGLVSWWRAEGNANDWQANGNGTLVGGVSFAQGEVGQCFSFNGVDGAINVADSPVYALTNSLSIEGWLYVTNPPAQLGEVFFRGDTLGTIPYSLSARSDDGITTQVGFDLTDASNNVAAISSVMATGAWTYVAATLDGSTGLMKLYTNGTLAVQITTAVRPVGPLSQVSHPGIGIGNYSSQPGPFPLPFKGRIDELSLYNRALTASEVLAIFNAGSAGKCTPPPAILVQPLDQTVPVNGTASFLVGATGAAPLIYQWSWNGTNIAGATNSSLVLGNVQMSQAGSYSVLVTNIGGFTNSRNAILTVQPAATCVAAPPGMVAWWSGEGNGLDNFGRANGTLYSDVMFTNGEVKQCFSFDGSNAGVNVPDVSVLALTNSLTIEGWLYVTNPPTVPGVVLMRGDTRPGLDPYVLIVQPAANGNYLNFGITDPANETAGLGAPMPLGAWTHVAATLDDASGLMTIYTNAVIAAQTTTTIRPLGPLDPGSTPGLGIGNHPSQPAPYNYPFRGRIDELSVYNRALSQSEILSIYQGGSSGKCAPPPVIITQPTNETVYLGNTATFSVLVAGVAPLSYQWTWNATNIVGATNTSLVLTNVQFAQAGNYAVQINNPGGTTNSTNVVLTVLPPPPPAIVTQPTNETVLVGDTATFSVLAASMTPLSYQWSWNTTNIPGATNTALVLTNVQLYQAGTYSVQVTNLGGITNSTNVVLTVLLPPPCFTPPTNLISWWRAESNTLDQIGANNGTLAGNATYGQGRVGTGFVFDGSGDGVVIGNPANLQLQNFTIEAWVKRTSSTTVSFGSGGNGFIFGYGSGSLAFFMDSTGIPSLTRVGVDQVKPTSSIAITDTAFHHLAVTRSGNTVVFYVDGVAYAANAYGSVFTYTTAGGVGVRGDTLDNSFYGTIDEISIYGRALAPSEIQGIYAASKTGKCVVPVPPFLITQPTNQTVVQGSNVTFSALAAGSIPFSYQWTYHGTPINGATNSSLTLPNVQVSQAGSYALIVTNVAGAFTSTNALLTVNFPPAQFRLGSTNAAAGSAVSVPLIAVLNGNENALGLSVGFDTSKLTYTGATAGSAVAGGELILNTSLISSGKLGVSAIMPAGFTFNPGTQTLAQINFVAAVLTNAATTTNSFGDQPEPRQLWDTQFNSQPATYTNGTVAISAATAFEGDTYPRPNGDKTVTLSDWLQMGRYVARLDYPTNAAEFQRADCAPRSTLGDGAITVADWVQAGRYAFGWDPLTPAGGPSVEGAYSGAGPSATRVVGLGQLVLLQGYSGTLSVNLAAQGNENGLSFSVMFDPTLMTYNGASLGAGAVGADLLVNSSQAASGKLGFALKLETGTSFPPGPCELIRLNFIASSSNFGSFSPTFGDLPVPREIADAGAIALPASFTNTTQVVINPIPLLSIGLSGESVVLSWQMTATNFILQEADGGGAPPMNWTNLMAQPMLTNGESSVTLPLSNATKLYRLRYQP